MSSCRKCAHYRTRPYGDAFCHKTGAAVGTLWQRDCFTEKEQEIKNTFKEMDNVIKTTKVCKDCGRELPVAAFAHHPKSKDGLNSICKECMTRKQKASHPKGEKKKHAPATRMEQEVSRACKAVEEIIVNEMSHPQPQPGFEQIREAFRKERPLVQEGKPVKTAVLATDEELLAELKARGYKGVISKQFTL